MKIYLIFAFIVLSLISSSEISTDLLSLKDQLKVFHNEFTAAPKNFIDFFPNLKRLYSCCRTLLKTNPRSKEISQMSLIMYDYCINCQKCFTESSLDCLRSVREYRNFELIYLFSYYLTVIKDKFSFKTLSHPLEVIRRYNKTNWCFTEHKYHIVTHYGSIFRRILGKPFVAPQEQANLSDDSKAPSQTRYDTGLDWKERKKILNEVIYTLMDLNVKNPCGVTFKIEKYEFVKREFQIDNNEPNFDHSVQIFHQLQRQISQSGKINYKLLALFRIYYIHLGTWQMIDPILFPKQMLAIISHQNLRRKKMIKLFKLPIKDIFQRAVKSLEEGQIKDLNSKVCNLDTNFIPAKSHGKSFGRELWHNLMNLEKVLTPFEQWIVKVYLVLSKQLKKLPLSERKNNLK
jgi:hypothetical protein